MPRVRHAHCGYETVAHSMHVDQVMFQLPSHFTLQQKLLYAYLSEARSKGSMHGGRKLACGALPSKEEPFTDALCHDVIVLSAL